MHTPGRSLQQLTPLWDKRLVAPFFISTVLLVCLCTTLSAQISIDPPSPSICPGESVTMTVVADDPDNPPTTFSWSPVDGLDDPSAQVVNASPASTTTYTVTTDVGTAAVTVNVLENPDLIADASGTNPTTCGAADGEISLIFTRMEIGDQNITLVPVGIYTIYYDGDCFPNVEVVGDISSTSATIQNVSAGDYNNLRLRRTPNSCLSALGMNVTLTNPAPLSSYTFNGGGPLCEGETSNLNVTVLNGVNTPSYTVVLQDDQGNPPLTINDYVSGTNIPLAPTPTLTTVYTVVSVTYMEVCDIPLAAGDDGQETITPTPLPTATLTSSDADNTVCGAWEGSGLFVFVSFDDIAFTASGGDQYTFYLNGVIVQGPGTDAVYTTGSVAPNGDENFTFDVYVQVTDAAGCSATSSSITTTVNRYPEITNATWTDPATCGGTGVIMLNFNVPEFLGENNFSTVPDGSYTISYDGDNFPDPVDVVDGLTTIAAPAGVYNNLSITVNGCTSQEDWDVVLTDPAPPTPSLSSSAADNTICEGEEVTFTASGGTIYEFFLNDASVQGPSTTATYVSNTLADGDEVYVIVTDAAMCSATSATITTTVNPLPIPTLSSSDADNTVCGAWEGSGLFVFVSFDDIAFTASGGDQYTFYLNGVIVQGPGTDAVYTTGSVAPNGDENFTFDVYVQVTDAAGCSATSSSITTTVNRYPEITNATWTDPATCGGTGVIMLNFNVPEFLGENNFSTVPDGSYTISYDGDNFPDPVDVVDGLATIAAPAGEYNNLSITVNGCTSQEDWDVVLTDPAPPTPSLSSSAADNTICEGEEVNFTASGGTIYEFFLNDASVQGPSTTATYVSNTLADGDEVYIIVTDDAMCSATSATITTSVIPLPTATLNSSALDNTICAGEEVTFTANGGVSYDFFVNDILVQSGPANTYATSDLDNGSQVYVNVYSSVEFACFLPSPTLLFTVNPIPVISNANGTDPTTCGGFGSIELNFELAGVPNGTYPIDYDGGTFTALVTGGFASIPATAGDYNNLSITINGCTSVEVWNITLNDPAGYYEVTLGTSAPEICLGETTTLAFTIDESSGATAPYTVIYLDENGMPVTQTNYFSGTPLVIEPMMTNAVYTGVSVVDANGCSGTFNPGNGNTLAITVNPLPVIDLFGDASLCAGQSTATITAQSDNVSDWLWSTGESTNEIVVDEAGTYTVTVTNTNGCTNENSFVVTENQPPSVFLAGDTELCEGQTTATLLATCDCGESNLSWSWSTGESEAEITVSTGGDYIVTATDENGCTGEATFTVASNPFPELTIIGEEEICEGQGEVALFAQSDLANDYLWSTGATGNEILVNSGGTYEVSVTNSFGCTTTSDYTVIGNALPIVDIFGDASLCVGQGSATITAQSDDVSDWLWSTGESDNEITVEEAGSYSVTVTDGNGCMGENSFLVGENTPPQISLGGDAALCEGQSTATLTAGCDCDENNLTWLWSTGETGNEIEVSAIGTYSVTATDENGCLGESSFTVISNTAPEVVISGDDTLCEGQSTATLTAASSTAISYLWSTGESGTEIIVDAGGTYSVTVTNAAGCTGEASYIVPGNNLPSVSIIGESELCFGQSGATLTAQGNNATGWLWSTGETTPSINVLTAGTFSVTVSDDNGCQGESSFTVEGYEPPTVSISGDATLCLGQTTATLLADCDCTNPSDNTWSWSTGNTGQEITVDAGNTYSVTTTDENGCTGEASLTVIGNTPPEVVITGDDNLCDGESTNLLAESATATSYLWTTGATDATIPAATSGTYSVTVLDEDGCTAMADFDLNVNAPFEVSIAGDAGLCIDQGVAILSATGANAVAWSWSSTQTTSEIEVTQAGTYTVTATDVNDCLAESSFTVAGYEPPAVAITGDDNLCLGQTTATLLADCDCTNPSGNTWSWSTGDTGQEITVDAGNTYSVTTTDENGCTGESSLTVIGTPPPEVVITGDDNLCDGESTSLLAESATATSYLWTTGATDATIPAATSGTYSVTVLDEDGCTAMADFDLTLNAPFEVAIAGDAGLCIDQGVATLSATGDNAIAWSWSSTQTTSEIEVTQAGTYTVTATDVNDCLAESSFTVAGYEPPAVAITGDTEFCEGQTSATLVAACDCAPFNLAWSWSTNENADQITVTTAGTYSVTTTDENGCAGDATVDILSNAPPEVIIEGDDFLCEGQTTATLTAQSADATAWLWSTGEITSELLVATGGTYDVTVTSAAGCTAESSSTVTGGTGPAAATFSGDAIICDGETTPLSLMIEGGTEPFSVIFSDGTEFFVTDDYASGNPILVMPEVNTDYTPVIVSDANGCTLELSGSITVVVNETPSAAFTGLATTYCTDQPAVLLQPAQSGGTMTVDPAVSGALTDLGGSYSFDPNVYAAGETVTLTYEIGVGMCFESMSISTTILPVPEVSIEPIVGTFCANEAPFTITGNPASAGGTFTSNLPNGFTDNGDGTAVVDPSLVPFGVGYDINYVYTSTDGCTATATTSMFINPLPDAEFTGLNETYFVNDSMVTISSTQTGGVFSSMDPIVLIDNGDGTASIDPSLIEVGGPYTVSYAIIDANGCMNESSQTFSIIAIAEVSFAGLTPIYCEGEDLVTLTGAPADGNGVFTATTPAGALVNNGDGTATLDIAALAPNTLFEVTYTYTQGSQTIEATQSFQVEEAPTIDLPESVILCGPTLLFVGPGNEENDVSWSTGATTPEITVETEGLFTVEVISANGCSTEGEVEVIVQPGIELLSNFLVADAACVGQPLQFIDVSSVLDGVISYLWDFGDQSPTSTEQDPVHAYATAGTFEVTLAAEVDGCEVVIVSKPITINNCLQGPGSSIFDSVNAYPNPNQGDFQVAVQLKRLEPVKVSVFDVYGRAVTEQNGRDNSSYLFSFNDLPTGTYFINIQSYGQRQIKRVVVVN